MSKIISVFFAVFAVAIGFAEVQETEVSEKSYAQSKITNLISLPPSDQREKGAKSILGAMDSDTTWAFEIIIKGLQIEEDYLENSKTIPEGYVWKSWWNIQRYIRDLALLGSNSGELLEEFGRTLSAGQKTWVTIAAGYQKDVMVHDELRKVITESDNILQKAMAIEAISQYRDTSDFSILIQAKMEEDNAIIWATDSDITGIDPVGMASDKAFWEMGLILEWDGEKYVLKRKEDVEIKYPKPEPGDQNE